MHLRLADEVRVETGVDPHIEATSSLWVAFNEAELKGSGNFSS